MNRVPDMFIINSITPSNYKNDMPPEIEKEQYSVNTLPTTRTCSILHLHEQVAVCIHRNNQTKQSSDISKKHRALMKVNNIVTSSLNET